MGARDNNTISSHPPALQARAATIIRAMDLYKATLTVFGHENGMPEASSGAPESDNEVNLYGVPSSLSTGASDGNGGGDGDLKELKAAAAPSSPAAPADGQSPALPWPDFDNRIDSVAVLLARQAPNLSVLVSAENSIWPANEVEITQFHCIC